MTDETIVAIFDTAAHAEAAAAGLKEAGVPATAISLHAHPDAVSTGTDTYAAPREEGFWASLFGGDPGHDSTVYDRSMAGGSTVVSVKAPESHVARVLDILESHHPIDIDERAASYGLDTTTTATARPMAGSAVPAVSPMPAVTTGRTGATASTPASEAGMLQLSEETLAVGKRVVNHGGTRIRRFVVETPVEENVSLHSEKVVLERRPVTDGRAPSGGFSDKTIEMTETAEEAVVSKSARVYEEVGLRKEVADRVETVRDTVRKEEVEVNQVPGTVTSGTTVPGSVKTVTTDTKLPPKV